MIVAPELPERRGGAVRACIQMWLWETYRRAGGYVTISETTGVGGNMERDSPYGDTVSMPVPLTYDKAIYWADAPYVMEYSVSAEVIQYSKSDVLGDARLRLAYAVERKARELGWGKYTAIEEITPDNFTLTIRHTFFERPGYRELQVFRAPPGWMTFRMLDGNHTVIDLPLRPLMYHGEKVRGALHEGTLLVVL